MKSNLIICLLTAHLNQGCVFGIEGSGNSVSENRTVEKFSGIDLQCSAHVFFTQSDDQSVKVEAEDNIISHITTEVKNDVLVISTDDENFTTRQPINIYVSVKELRLLELSGSGNMTGKNAVSCENMTIRIAGSGNIRTEMKAATLKMTLSGSGNLDVSGSASTTEIRISGSGNIHAKNLASAISAVTITGSGKSTINVSEELNVQITGSGDVNYVGEPARLKTSITGSGNVTKI